MFYYCKNSNLFNKRQHLLRFFNTLRRKDPFVYLNLPRTSSLKQVKERYYNLIKQLHPDLNKNVTKQQEEKNRQEITLLNEYFKEAYSYAKNIEKYRQQQLINDENDLDENVEDIIKRCTKARYINIKDTEIYSSGIDRGAHFWMQSFREQYGDNNIRNTDLYQKKRKKKSINKRRKEDNKDT